MKKLIDTYEQEIEILTRRSKELHARLRAGVPERELASLRGRCEALDAERLELMRAVAEMKRIISPKRPHPSVLAEGDAAC